MPLHWSKTQTPQLCFLEQPQGFPEDCSPCLVCLVQLSVRLNGRCLKLFLLSHRRFFGELHEADSPHLDRRCHCFLVSRSFLKQKLEFPNINIFHTFIHCTALKSQYTSHIISQFNICYWEYNKLPKSCSQSSEPFQPRKSHFWFQFRAKCCS